MRTFFSPATRLSITTNENIDNANRTRALKKQFLREIIDKQLRDSVTAPRGTLETIKQTLGNTAKNAAVMASSMAMATALTDTVANLYPDEPQKQQSMTLLFSLITVTSINLLSKVAQTITSPAQLDSFAAVQKNFFKDLFNQALGRTANNLENLGLRLYDHYYEQSKAAIAQHLTADLWLQAGDFNEVSKSIVEELVQDKVALALRFFQGEGLATAKRILLGTAGFSTAMISTGISNHIFGQIFFQGVKEFKSVAAGAIGGATALGIAWAGQATPHKPVEYCALISAMFASMTAAMEYFPSAMLQTASKSLINAGSGAISATVASAFASITESCHLRFCRRPIEANSAGELALNTVSDTPGTITITGLEATF
jgi:hypothetical protein